MNLFNSISEKRDLIGKIFFIISMIILLYMFISPLNKTYIHVDEYFTLSIIQFPLNEMWSIILNDVHPPLYYFILIIFVKIFSSFMNTLLISKIVSIIPYLLLIIISMAKIKEEYNWFTAGLFTFSIGIMSGFLIQFLTARMYGWSLFFLVMSFIYMKDVLIKSDLKSWLLFTIFSIFSIYTHNILLISVGFIYLTIIVNILLNINNKKEKITELKKWFVSTLICILSYVPWLFVILGQINAKHGNGNTSFNLQNFFDCLLSFINSTNNIILQVLGLIFLILIIIIILNQYFDNKNKDNYYILSGIIIFLLTLIVSAIIIPLLFAPIYAKYLLTVCGIMWLSISILLNNVKNKKLFSILILLIILMGCLNSISLLNESNNLYKVGHEENIVLEQINNKNNVYLYPNEYNYIYYHNHLNETQGYNIKKFKNINDNNITFEKNITKILLDNNNKNIYTMKKITNESDLDYGKNISATKVGGRGYNWIIKLELKDDLKT